MTILDLINKSAIMLNIKEILNDTSLITISATNEKDVLDDNFALKRMFEFAKIVLNEVNSYAPKVEEVSYTTVGKTIPRLLLTRLSKVIGVKNEYGYVKYSVDEDGVYVDEDGRYTVIFNQYPLTNSVFDEIEIYNDSIKEDLLINGLNSYYCLATGLLEEFNIYNAHYAERLSQIKNLKVFAMPCRSWQ
ncbi:MAG: hypothetical protein IJ358_00505 [Clostridia bacterium]|nr:hypothetical protein [Clostridia bacterium]